MEHWITGTISAAGGVLATVLGLVLKWRYWDRRAQSSEGRKGKKEEAKLKHEDERFVESQLRRLVLLLQNQIETIQVEVVKLRGEGEKLGRQHARCIKANANCTARILVLEERLGVAHEGNKHDGDDTFDDAE